MKKSITVARYVMTFVVLLVVIYIGLNSYQHKQKIIFADHLNDVVFTLNGQDVYLKDFMFYIASMETRVEEEAKVYNKTSTKDYWNAHANGHFISEDVKESVFNMVVHDYLFYELAKEEGLELSQEDLIAISNSKCDFYEDLLDNQLQLLEAMNITEEVIDEQMRLAALAEKYQEYLAAKNNGSVASYKADGYYYKLILDEHTLIVNRKLWDRIVIGDVTLIHKKVQFINGYEES